MFTILSILGMYGQAMPIKNDSINLGKTVMLICQKINFISQFFLEIFQRSGKLVTSNNFGRPGHVHKD